MGVLRRNPGDKVVVNPIKFWGALSVLALFASISFYYFGGKSTSAKINASEAPEPEIETKQEVKPLEVKDPNCEEIFQGELNEDTHELDISGAPEAGLVALCGRVGASIIDNNEAAGGMPRSRDTKENIIGATVAVYENAGGGTVELEAGNASGKNAIGELVHLFSSTYTNKEGYYRLKMRGLGPNSNSVYVVVLCNGQYAGGKRVNSLHHNGILNITANCDPDEEYTYIIPPYSLKIVNRDKVQECTTVGSQMMTEFQGGPAAGSPIYLPVKYEETAKVTVGGLIREHNYDFRYVSKPAAMEKTFAGGTGVNWDSLFENNSGALWYGDCMYRMGQKAYSGNRTYDWVCSSKTINEEYGQAGGYLINNTLPFIPEKSELLPYRRLDNRSSFKQINQSPFAVQQYTTKTFGNLVTTSPFLKNALNNGDITLNEMQDPIASCEALEYAKVNHTFFDPDAESFINAYVTSGWGLNLMSPYTVDRIQELGLLGEDLERKYCKMGSGQEYTLRQVLDDYELRRRYFHTAAMLPKGSGGLPWNFQSDDSVFQEFIARAGDLFPFFTEAEIAHRDRTQSILPPNHNWTANTVGNLFASGGVLEDGVLFRTGNLLSGLYSPYGDTAEDVFAVEEEEEEEETEETEEGEMKLPAASKGVDGDQVWDLGNFITGECAVSKIHNVDEGYFKYNPIARDWGDYKPVLPNLHNFFPGNPFHLIDSNVGSGTYYSSDSKKRDELLSDDAFVGEAADKGAEIFGQRPGDNRDIFDSILEMTAGGVTPVGDTGVNLQKITGVQVLELQIGNYIGLIIDGLANAINLINDIFGTNINSSFGLSGNAPTKSLGDREDFQATYLFNDQVYYPLSAANFPTYFPSYSEGCLGCLGHDDYPWAPNGAPLKGQTCDVYPGPGNPPDDDPLNIGGMRTCKIAACRVFIIEYRWDEVNQKWKDEKDTRGCTEEEEYEILTEQVDMWPSSHEEACGSGPTGLENTDPLWSGDDCEQPVANLIVAGPYKYIAPFELHFNAMAEQDFVADDNDEQKAVSMDPALDVAHRTAQMLSSPGTKYNERNLAFLDWDFTKNPNLRKQFGHDTAGPFVGFEQTSATGASPTSLAGMPPYEEIWYHCNVEFVDMEDNPRDIPGDIESNIVIPGIEYDWDCKVRPFIMGECDPELFNEIQGGMPYPIPEAENYFQLYVLSKMTPTLLDAYGFASVNTGVPCEIVAGVHHMEGSNNPDQSVHDGHPINVSDLPYDAFTAMEHLKGKLSSKDVKDWKFQDYVLALSYYNGGGNSNCTDPITPWCQPGTTIQFYGWDDPYPMSWIDGDHVGMYVKYCFDLVLCTEVEVNGTDESGWLPINRPGAIAIASILNKLLNDQ